MSEARLNDLVYLTLKTFLFTPMGMGGPRECDIRICMDMAAPERITSIQSAILSPTETAGKSHDIFYEISTDQALETTIDYIEDHWLKASLEEAYGDPNVKDKVKETYAQLVECIMKTPEAECATTLPPEAN